MRGLRRVAVFLTVEIVIGTPTGRPLRPRFVLGVRARRQRSLPDRGEARQVVPGVGSVAGIQGELPDRVGVRAEAAPAERPTTISVRGGGPTGEYEVWSRDEPVTVQKGADAATRRGRGLGPVQRSRVRRVSVVEVARVAEVSEATVFNCFPSKGAIMHSGLDRVRVVPGRVAWTVGGSWSVLLQVMCIASVRRTIHVTWSSGEPP